MQVMMRMPPSALAPYAGALVYLAEGSPGLQTLNLGKPKMRAQLSAATVYKNTLPWVWGARFGAFGELFRRFWTVCTVV